MNSQQFRTSLVNQLQGDRYSVLYDQPTATARLHTPSGNYALLAIAGAYEYVLEQPGVSARGPLTEAEYDELIDLLASKYYSLLPLHG